MAIFNSYVELTEGIWLLNWSTSFEALLWTDDLWSFVGKPRRTKEVFTGNIKRNIYRNPRLYYPNHQSYSAGSRDPTVFSRENHAISNHPYWSILWILGLWGNPLEMEVFFVAVIISKWWIFHCNVEKNPKGNVTNPIISIVVGYGSIIALQMVCVVDTFLGLPCLHVYFYIPPSKIFFGPCKPPIPISEGSLNQPPSNGRNHHVL